MSTRSDPGLPVPSVLPGGAARRERMRVAVLDSLFGPGPSRMIGRYRLERVLGEGAMGVVYLAHDEKLDRTVALKQLTARALDRAPSASSSTVVQRMLREARLMAQLDDPHLVPVYDVGFEDDVPYIVMEHVAGGTLRDWLGARPRSTAEILEVFEQAGKGLIAAHCIGVVHRDFKPGNVLMDGVTGARVADFGLASQRGEATKPEPSPSSSASLEVGFTATGWVMGTPGYMAPEQHLGERIGPQTDQYAYCVALFEALHGHRPFTADSLDALLAKKQAHDIRPGTRRLSRQLERALVKGMAFNPQDRFASMDDLLAALRPNRRSRSAWLGASVSGLALVALLVPRQGEEAASCADLDQATPHWTQSEAPRGRLGLAATKQLDHLMADAIADWHTAVEQVCADDEEGVQARTARLSCLRGHAERMQATIDVFESDAELNDDAVMIAARLEPPHHCQAADLDAVEPPPPPERAEAVRRLEAALAAELARTQTMSGAEDLERAVVLADKARELDHVPTLARTLRQLAACASSVGELDDAIAYASEAYFASVDAHVLPEALRAAVVLTNLTGSHRRDKEQGQEWANHARALLGRLDAPLEEAALQRALGHVAWEQQDFASALERYRGSLATLDSMLDPPGLERAQVLHNLADSLDGLGHRDEARRMFERVLEIEVEILGEDHVTTHSTRASIADMDVAAGRAREAIPVLEATLAAHERAYGPEHPEVGKWYANLAAAQMGFDPMGARTNLRRAVAIYEAVGHKDLAITLANLGIACWAAEDLEEAETHLLRALDLLEHDEGAPLYIAMAANNLGLVAEAAGDYESAIRHYERALGAKVAALGESHLSVARTRVNLALTYLATERFEDAMAHFQAALTIVEAAQEAPPKMAPSIRRLIARSALGLGDLALATTEAAHARRLSEQLGPDHRPEQIEKLDALDADIARARGS